MRAAAWFGPLITRIVTNWICGIATPSPTSLRHGRFIYNIINFPLSIINCGEAAPLTTHHLPTFTPSHLPTFTPSHLHHLPTFLPSHRLPTKEHQLLRSKWTAGVALLRHEAFDAFEALSKQFINLRGADRMRWPISGIVAHLTIEDC